MTDAKTLTCKTPNWNGIVRAGVPGRQGRPRLIAGGLGDRPCGPETPAKNLRFYDASLGTTPRSELVVVRRARRHRQGR